MESQSIFVRGCRPGKRKTCFSVVVLAVLIGIVLFAYQAFGTKSKDSTLKKAFFIFRHGDRNPTETYPKDPYLNYDWPGGWGALTTLGKRQMYRLGQRFRDDYGWMTNYEYRSSNVMVNSSWSDRCIMSTQSLLAGLYPPKPDEALVEGLSWQPIVVHYLPKYLDEILVVGKSCPKLTNALKEAFRNESLRSDEKLKLYYNNLTEFTGQEMKTIMNVEFLYNTLEIEYNRGMKLPEWTKRYFNDEMRELAARSYALFTSNVLQRRLRGGPLLKHILNNMKNGKDEEKIFLYGTHDINIVNTLRAMGFTDELFKLDIGVSLTYELHVPRDSQIQQVHIFMLNNTKKETIPHKLKIPGCKSDPCLLDELFDVWNDVLPDDWNKECQM